MLRMPHVIWRMEERKSTEWNKRVHPTTHCTIFLPSFVGRPPRFSSVNPTVKQRRRCENPRLSFPGCCCVRHIHHRRLRRRRRAAQRDISALFVRAAIQESFLSKKFHSPLSRSSSKEGGGGVGGERRLCTNWRRQQIDSFLLLLHFVASPTLVHS